jgi:Helix-turn-helix domain
MPAAIPLEASNAAGDEFKADRPHSGILAGYTPEEEMAGECGESEKTWQRRRRARRGPPYTVIGRRIYYRREAVVRWLREQEQALDKSAPKRRAARG